MIFVGPFQGSKIVPGTILFCAVHSFCPRMSWFALWQHFSASTVVSYASGTDIGRSDNHPLHLRCQWKKRDRGGLLHCKEFDIMQLIPQQQPSVMGFIITVWPETMSITWLYGSLHSWHEQCIPHISFPVIWKVCHMLVTIKTSLYDQRPWIDPG